MPQDYKAHYANGGVHTTQGEVWGYILSIDYIVFFLNYLLELSAVVGSLLFISYK